MSDLQLSRVRAILDKFVDMDYIGEAVSQLEHSLQCAYFAEKCGHSDEIIIACLLHDIGHIALASPQPQMDGLGVINHEWIGARLLLEMGFSNTVAQLVGHHVNAKRYLSGKKPAYYRRLSSASQGTLTFQGGPMTASERAVFEALPLFKQILQVRAHDEKGKEVDLITPPLEYYLGIIEKHLSQCQMAQQSNKHLFCLSDYPVSSQKIDSLGKHHDFDIGLIDQVQPFHSSMIYDYNLTQLSQPIFMEETIQLIQQSVLNRYLLLANPVEVKQLAKLGGFELTML